MSIVRATQTKRTTAMTILAREIDLGAEDLLQALLALPNARRLSLLD